MTKLANLQALRGIACVLVVLYHAGCFEQVYTYPKFRHFLFYSHFGFAGVDLFFVISGFIITWINWDFLGQPRQLLGHLFKRVWRVYPLMWFAWFFSAVTVLCFAEIDLEKITSVLPNALTLWTYRDSDFFILAQAWTLAYEVVFYVVFCVFFLLPRRLFLPVLALWAGCCCGALIGPSFGLDPSWKDVRILRPLNLEFLAGCLVAALVKRECLLSPRMVLRIGLAAGAIAIVLQCFRISVAETNVVHRLLLFGLPSMLVVYGLIGCEMTHGTVLSRRWQLLGDASYSLYLMHLPALYAVTMLTFHRGHNNANHALWSLLCLGVSFILGVMVYVGLERPLMRFPKWFARLYRGTQNQPRNEPSTTWIFSSAPYTISQAESLPARIRSSTG